MTRWANWAMIVSAVAVVALATTSHAQRRPPRDQRERPPASPQTDKRDRVVSAPGNPFNGRPYWLAMSQCGGIYFRLNTLYSNEAITAQVVKPDRAALAELNKKSEAARRMATAFFNAAEAFLIADRGIARDEAVVTYDTRASEAGDRLKTVDAALQATKACPALYKACRDSVAKICSETAVSSN